TSSTPPPPTAASCAAASRRKADTPTSQKPRGGTPMRHHRRLLVLLPFVLAAGLAAPAFAAGPGPKALIPQVQQLKGYTQIDKKDPSRPVLRVELRSFNLKDDDLKNLRPHLQKSPLPVALSLSGASGITDAGLAHLKDLTTLVSLGLGDVKYTDAG